MEERVSIMSLFYAQNNSAYWILCTLTQYDDAFLFSVENIGQVIINVPVF